MSIKDDWIDDQNSQNYEKNIKTIADYFGLTIEETVEADPEWEEDFSNDGGAVGMIINFSRETKPSTLAKLDGQLSHNVDLHFFGSVVDGDDEELPENIVYNEGDGFLDWPTEEALKVAKSVDKKNEENKD